jgi:hypothetical protein
VIDWEGHGELVTCVRLFARERVAVGCLRASVKGVLTESDGRNPQGETRVTIHDVDVEFMRLESGGCRVCECQCVVACLLLCNLFEYTISLNLTSRAPSTVDTGASLRTTHHKRGGR